jgi:flotillin
VAEAEALRAEGEAQASAILATGQAEAEAMNKRAEAFARYNEAAVLQMLVEVLPKVAREVAAPMAGIEKLTVVSTDGAGAMPRQVTNNVVQTMELLKNTTGVDFETLLRRFTDSAAKRPTEEAAAPPE